MAVAGGGGGGGGGHLGGHAVAPTFQLVTIYYFVCLDEAANKRKAIQRQKTVYSSHFSLCDCQV